MKKITPLLVVLCISFATTAGNWPYNRLERLYKRNPSKCLKISKRYIKLFPDKAAPYFFASLVYKDKTKTHSEDKTRYMMMSKSIGYAMKFEEKDNVDLQKIVSWDKYLIELAEDTDALISELDNIDLANLGDRLAIKHQNMVDNRDEIILIADNSGLPPVSYPVSSGSQASAPTEEGAVEPDNSEKKGYYGLAHGREMTPSYNKIQESLLLDLINEEREALFMQPLKWEEDLARAARYHAHDMASQDYFLPETYDRIDGNLVEIADAETRNAQFYDKNKINDMNMASSSINADATFNQWLTFDEQYDVLFDESSKKVGIGLAYDPESSCGYYWVLITAKR